MRDAVLTLGSRTWSNPRDPERKQDEILTALLAMVVVFNPLGLRLTPEGRQRMELTHRKYSHVLFKYLKTKLDNSEVNERFAQGMASMRVAMQVDELKRRALIQRYIKEDRKEEKRVGRCRNVLSHR